MPLGGVVIHQEKELKSSLEKGPSPTLEEYFRRS